jgi:hypothetical protein
MANETTTTTLTELVRQAAYAKGVLYFSTRPGVSNFVAKMDITGQPTLTARFPIYDSVTATAIAENTDFTTNSAVDSSGSVDVTVSEHAIRFIITNLTLNATVEEVLAPNPSPQLAAMAQAQGGIVGQMIAESIQTRQDKDITALFAGFDSSTGSNTGAITTTLFQTAITTLDANNIPQLPRIAVIHPFQWGSLRVAFSNASTFGAKVGEDVVQRGITAQVLGVDIFATGNVGTATVSSSTVFAAAMFHPSAVAVAQKGALPEIASEYDASLRAVEVVGTGVWGEAEYRGGATTNGRGGAGIFLYSNSTVA